MIRGALRRFRSLSFYHYRTIIFTMLLPAIWPTMIANFGPDPLALQVILYVAAFLVWSVFAVLAVASMLNRDRSEAEQLVAKQLDALSSQITRLREEEQDSRFDLRRQLNDLEEVVRSTLSARLGVILPPRPVSIRVKATAGSPTASITVTVDGEARLCVFDGGFDVLCVGCGKWSTGSPKTARQLSAFLGARPKTLPAIASD